MDESVWVATVFSKNHDWLLMGEIAEKFFAQVLEQSVSGRIELAASRHPLTKSNLAKRLQRMWVVGVRIGVAAPLLGESARRCSPS